MSEKLASVEARQAAGKIVTELTKKRHDYWMRTYGSMPDSEANKILIDLIADSYAAVVREHERQILSWKEEEKLWREREMDLLRKLGSYEEGAEKLIEDSEAAERLNRELVERFCLNKTPKGGFICTLEPDHTGEHKQTDSTGYSIGWVNEAEAAIKSATPKQGEAEHEG